MTEFLNSEERIKKIYEIELDVNFGMWEAVIKANFPELVFPAEIAMSMLTQILIKDITNPFALVLIGPPSSGKTICINFFNKIAGFTYASDKFSPASFVSNAANVKKEDLPKVDLLPRIRYKMFLIRDFTTTLSKREEDLTELLGLMTRALDGQGLDTDTGIHGSRKVEGEYLFMMLAASTPIQPRVLKTMGNLGSRIFFLHMRGKEKNEEELAEQIISANASDKEKVCHVATRQFVHTLWFHNPDGINWKKDKDPKECILMIARAAKLLACLRGVINIWQDESVEGKFHHQEPNIEHPDRINQLFYNLARGHALIHGRSQITTDDLTVVLELAIDSAQIKRVRLFRALLDNSGSMTTSQVMEALKCSQTTALKEMEVLGILGICDLNKHDQYVVGRPENQLQLRAEWKWFISDECRALRRPSDKDESTGANLGSKSDN